MSAQHTPRQFGYPDSIDYQAACLASKTHRLPDGRFEATAAIFFMGKRGLTVYAVAGSRSRARREAEAATETQSKLQRALADGRVSYTPYAIAKATGSAS